MENKHVEFSATDKEAYDLFQTLLQACARRGSKKKSDAADQNVSLAAWGKEASSFSARTHLWQHMLHAHFKATQEIVTEGNLEELTAGLAALKLESPEDETATSVLREGVEYLKTHNVDPGNSVVGLQPSSLVLQCLSMRKLSGDEFSTTIMGQDAYLSEPQDLGRHIVSLHNDGFDAETIAAHATYLSRVSAALYPSQNDQADLTLRQGDLVVVDLEEPQEQYPYLRKHIPSDGHGGPPPLARPDGVYVYARVVEVKFSGSVVISLDPFEEKSVEIKPEQVARFPVCLNSLLSNREHCGQLLDVGLHSLMASIKQRLNSKIAAHVREKKSSLEGILKPVYDLDNLRLQAPLNSFTPSQIQGLQQLLDTLNELDKSKWYGPMTSSPGADRSGAGAAAAGICSGTAGVKEAVEDFKKQVDLRQWYIPQRVRYEAKLEVFLAKSSVIAQAHLQQIVNTVQGLSLSLFMGGLTTIASDRPHSTKPRSSSSKRSVIATTSDEPIEMIKGGTIGRRWAATHLGGRDKKRSYSTINHEDMVNRFAHPTAGESLSSSGGHSANGGNGTNTVGTGTGGNSAEESGTLLSTLEFLKRRSTLMLGSAASRRGLFQPMRRGSATPAGSLTTGLHPQGADAKSAAASDSYKKSKAASVKVRLQRKRVQLGTLIDEYSLHCNKMAKMVAMLKPLQAELGNEKKNRVKSKSIRLIFDGVTNVWKMEQELLRSMSDCISKWPQISIGNAFAAVEAEFEPLYLEYIKSLHVAVLLFNNLCKNNKFVHNFFKKNSEMIEKGSSRVDDFYFEMLKMPLTRLESLRQFFEKCSRDSNETDDDWHQMERWTERVNIMCENAKVRDQNFENLTHLFEVSKRISCFPGKLVKHGRTVLMEGAMLVTVEETFIPELPVREESHYFFLMSDILIQTAPEGKKKDRVYNVVRVYPLTCLELSMATSAERGDSFSLIVLVLSSFPCSSSSSYG